MGVDQWLLTLTTRESGLAAQILPAQAQDLRDAIAFLKRPQSADFQAVYLAEKVSECSMEGTVTI